MTFGFLIVSIVASNIWEVTYFLGGHRVCCRRRSFDPCQSFSTLYIPYPHLISSLYLLPDVLCEVHDYLASLLLVQPVPFVSYSYRTCPFLPHIPFVVMSANRMVLWIQISRLRPVEMGRQNDAGYDRTQFSLLTSSPKFLCIKIGSARAAFPGTPSPKSFPKWQSSLFLSLLF